MVSGSVMGVVCWSRYLRNHEAKVVFLNIRVIQIVVSIGDSRGRVKLGVLFLGE